LHFLLDIYRQIKTLHHNRVENTLQNNKNHTKQCGKGSDVEQMRRMVRSVD
jgi:hypothetical protein